MKTFSKSTAYASLSEIKQQGIDTSKYIKEIANSDTVPYSVIVFINKYIPIEQLFTYNKIYENRRKNPLYKNLVNENLPTEERAIAITSLLTQVMIRLKEFKNSEDATEYASIMNVKSLSEAVVSYSVYGDPTLLNEEFMSVRDMFKKLFN